MLADGSPIQPGSLEALRTSPATVCPQLVAAHWQDPRLAQIVAWLHDLLVVYCFSELHGPALQVIYGEKNRLKDETE